MNTFSPKKIQVITFSLLEQKEISVDIIRIPLPDFKIISGIPFLSSLLSVSNLKVLYVYNDYRTCFKTFCLLPSSSSTASNSCVSISLMKSFNNSSITTCLFLNKKNTREKELSGLLSILVWIYKLVLS